MPITQRKLGSQGLVVPSLGLGCMGFAAFYGAKDPRQSEEANIEVIGHSLKLGMNFLDTAWIYQDIATGYASETLVGKALKRYGRDKFIVATKFGIEYTELEGFKPNGSPELIRKQLAESLARLDIDCIDLYYQHRMDPNVPIETTMQCLKELVEEGKIKYIGLSECSPSELRRAHAIHPITAIQMEWSLNTRDLEHTVVPVARELGIGIVAYSPLGRGLLSGTFKNFDSIDSTDFRRTNPRFANGNLEKNTPYKFFEIAKRKGCTPAQLALAWVLSRGEDVVPIPGTSKIERLTENVGATDVVLSPEECLEIESSIPEIEGERYAQMHGTFNQRL